MSGDYSRWGFDPRANYVSVRLQQGRPLLDRDWNELATGIARRAQAIALDTHGPFHISPATPDAFRITKDAAGGLLIGTGRVYIDGLLAENHGAAEPSAARTWDPVLGEEAAAAALAFTKQPHRKGIAQAPTTGAPFLVYLDVWQREVTHLTDPDLVDPAIGVDTTTRLQTVWQVRLIESLDAATTCASFSDAHPSWKQLLAPPAGRLSIGTAAARGDVNPCLVPPSGAFKGLENQLYRVEIHDGGAPGTATFKWSRENGSVAARVTHVLDATHIVVESLGKDDVLRFSEGDWIEILDDATELDQRPGLMRQVAVDGGVDEAMRVLTLSTGLPPDAFPANPQGVLDAGRHTRVRRWDQNGTIRDAAGDSIADLSNPASGGVVRVPTGNAQIVLEQGIVAQFSVDGSGGAGFRSGDHWIFAARATNASVDTFAARPPRGIDHHYARLAIVNPGAGPTGVEDCRFKALTLTSLAARVAVLESALAPRYEKESEQIRPPRGRRGVAEVTLRGGNFMAADNEVFFGTVATRPTEVTVGTLKVIVPETAALGPTKITIRNRFGSVTSDAMFLVTETA